MKRSLNHLLLHESILIKRNGIITVSLVVTTLYILVFKNLNLDSLKYGQELLITIVFNDPAILGFLFTGVMVLFEKNQNTYQALSVVPFDIKNYVLARAILLSMVSLICSFAMLWFSGIETVNYWVFGMAVLTCALTFSFIGFWVVAKQKSFNTYFIRAIGMVILLSIPIIALFGIGEPIYFVLFPTQASLYLFEAAFQPNASLLELFGLMMFAFVWMYFSYRMSLKAIVESFESL